MRFQRKEKRETGLAEGLASGALLSRRGLILSATSLALASGTRAQETPPVTLPAPGVRLDDNPTELHRIRIGNFKDGLVEVSTDEGENWTRIGRVTSAATSATEGYLAAEYAQAGEIAAVAVHGLRIRVSGVDTTLHAPLVVSVIPREFAGEPNPGFGGHVAGASGIRTDIPAGTSLFRDLAPRTGNPVLLQIAGRRLMPLPSGFRPRGGEMFVILVQEPARQLVEATFENRVGGKVEGRFSDGATELLTTVTKPVAGVGRFDATAFTGVGRLNTNHPGVITVSTAPINSGMREGEGKERRGGFQISPAWHNSRCDESGAPMILTLGGVGENGKLTRDLEGKSPLFRGQISIGGSEPVVDCRIDDGDWEPLPTAIGARLDAFTADGLNLVWKAMKKDRRCARGITAFRLRAFVPTVDSTVAAVVAAAESHRVARLASARANKVPILAGSVTINAPATDTTRVSFVRLMVDGAMKGFTNVAPFSFTWDTTRLPDGEYVIEVEAMDSAGAVVADRQQRVYIYNAAKG